MLAVAKCWLMAILRSDKPGVPAPGFLRGALPGPLLLCAFNIILDYCMAMAFRRTSSRAAKEQKNLIPRLRAWNTSMLPKPISQS